jgi:hypothetical protein
VDAPDIHAMTLKLKVIRRRRPGKKGVMSLHGREIPLQWMR